MIFSDSFLQPHLIPSPDGSRRTCRGRLAKKTLRDDETCVHRFNAGDESAFVEIMDRYRAKILYIALDLLHNHADAEEIVQDTFIRAYRGLARFRGDASLTTWLHRIAANLAHKSLLVSLPPAPPRHAYRLDCSLSDKGEATFADLRGRRIPEPGERRGE